VERKGLFHKEIIMHNHVKVIGKAVLLTALVAAMASTALAQGPPPPPMGGGGFGAWRAWSQAHPNIRQVGRTIRALGDLEGNPGTKLNKAQAKKVLAVLSGWRHKPVMTDAQAAGVVKSLTALLTPAQSKAAAAEPVFGGRRGGFGGGGMGGGRRNGPPEGLGGPGMGSPGGGPPRGGFGGGPGGPGRGMAMSKPHDYNPLNPETAPFGGRAKARLDALVAALTATK
jgi:hypothetical protein